MRAAVLLCITFSLALVHAEQYVQEAPGKLSDMTTQLLPPHRHCKIGILLPLNNKHTSIFANGWRQFTFFLFDALSLQDRYDVTLLGYGSDSFTNVNEDWLLPDSMSRMMLNDVLALDTPPFDLIIDVDIRLHETTVESILNKNIPLVGYVATNLLSDSLHRIIYDQPESGLYVSKPYNEIWLIPQFMQHAGFYRIAFEAPVKVAPFIWSPKYYEYSAQQYPNRPYYVPVVGKRRLVSLDDNQGLTRNAVTTMIAVELLVREDKDAITDALITNTDHVKTQNYFKQFVFDALTSHVKVPVMSFEARHPTLFMLANYADAVMSHHWGNETSLTLLEALYGGWPLIHNSKPLKECGYYYEDEDAYQAKDLIREALTNHQLHAVAYNKKVASCIWERAASNPKNIYEFDKLIEGLLKA